MNGFWTRLDNRGVLVVGGADRFALFQGMATADLRGLSPGRTLHALFLSPQGRWLFDSLIVDAGDRWTLDVERARIAEMTAWIARRRLRSEVTLADESDGWEVIALWGGAELPILPGETRSLAGGVVFADPRSPALGARAIVPADRIREATIGFEPAAFAEWDRRRIAAGVPDGARDLTPDRSLPLESGFDRSGSISFDKGCFIGQEVTARMRFRSAARRTVLPVRLEGEPPARGVPVTRDGAEIGRLLDGNGDLALASLKLEAVEGLRAGSEAEAGGTARLRLA